MDTETALKTAACFGSGMNMGSVCGAVTGGLMAQSAAAGTPMGGLHLAICAAFSSEIHGRAGELAQEKLGVRGMCASDLVDALPEALRAYA